MLFTSPIWLVGLLPWAAITIWLLTGSRRRQGVPFVAPWRTEVVQKRVERAVRPPPLGLAAMILAMLLAIAAAAGPALRVRGGGELTILVDRGIMMSAMGKTQPRYIEAAAILADAFRENPPGRVSVVDLLSGERHDSDGPGALEFIRSLRRTAIDTSPLARPAVVAELSRGQSTVVLLSDKRIELIDPRFKQIAPPARLRDVGISAIAVRELPTGGTQVMITIRNDSPLKEADLVVVSNGQEVKQHVTLSATTDSNEFIDLPRAGDVIEARLIASDDLEADNTAWLARENRLARVEIRAGISDALRRMVEVYGRAKPPGDGSPIVAIVNRPADLPTGDIGVIVGATGTQRLAGDTRIAQHPLTAIVNWEDALKGATGAAPPEGWQSLVSIGGRVVVAAREEPARQVWVGFDSAEWPRTADYVVFWTNVFDWLGGSAPAFVSHPMNIVPREWQRRGPVAADVEGSAWPGLFERSDGALRAVNARPVERHTAGKLSDIPVFRPAQERRDVGRWISLAAIVCVAIASLAWRGAKYASRSA